MQVGLCLQVVFAKEIPMIQPIKQSKNQPTLKPAIPSLLQSNAAVITTAPHRPRAKYPAPSLTSVLTHGDIAERAYDIYVQSGYHEGQSQQNWEQAEKDLHDQGLLACHAEHRRKEVFAPDALDAQ